jgi:hypothetical protein
VPVGKQAHARVQQLFDDLKQVMEDTERVTGELSWEDSIWEVAIGLWNKGWRHPERVELLEFDSTPVGGYFGTGEPVCKCENPRGMEKDGTIPHEDRCPRHKEVESDGTVRIGHPPSGDE